MSPFNPRNNIYVAIRHNVTESTRSDLDLISHIFKGGPRLARAVAGSGEPSTKLCARHNT